MPGLSPSMGRHRLRVPSLERGRGAPRWDDPDYTEWSAMVGDRVRRLRHERGLTLVQAAALVSDIGPSRYTPGYISRLERGCASAPLRVYVEIAVAFEVSPGRLLGSEELERPVGEGEMTLVALTRRLGIPPDEAIARIVDGSHVATGERSVGTDDPSGGAGIENRAAADGGLPTAP